ncbi:MAG: Holliday junction branch migration protein RuvA [Candidatus Heimdallarchaeota archaeon]|nr:Holliday junction branch migration protein RuvA [Candidatus Heimdallarchaeota archaeon]
MIESLKGILVKKEPTFVVLDLAGFRIKVNISVSSYESLPKLGEMAELLTYLHVREDILELYGFSGIDERELFLKLIGISGIGPRSGLTILSGASVDEFKSRIVNEDVESLMIIPGIGTKTARRIIVELKETFSDEITSRGSIDSDFGKRDEVLQALISLGFKKHQAVNAIKKIESSGEFEGTLEERIKKALNKM